MCFICEFIHLLFLATMYLHCFVWAFSSFSKWGLLFAVVHVFLIGVASLVAEHSLWMRGFSSCEAQAMLFRGMQNLPGPGIEPRSPALAGRFLSSAPPGKSKEVQVQDPLEKEQLICSPYVHRKKFPRMYNKRLSEISSENKSETGVGQRQKFTLYFIHSHINLILLLRVEIFASV